MLILRLNGAAVVDNKRYTYSSKDQTVYDLHNKPVATFSSNGEGELIATYNNSTSACLNTNSSITTTENLIRAALIHYDPEA